MAPNGPVVRSRAMAHPGPNQPEPDVPEPPVEVPEPPVSEPPPAPGTTPPVVAWPVRRVTLH
jgi:hypothetical protein